MPQSEPSARFSNILGTMRITNKMKKITALNRTGMHREEIKIKRTGKELFNAPTALLALLQFFGVYVRKHEI